MTNTIQQVDTLMRGPLFYNRHQGGAWHNYCEQFTNNLGGFTEDFSTALLAGNASGPLNPDISTIVDGAIGYWSGVWINGEENGHTAFWYQGRWRMASDAVTEMMGNGTGAITYADYARARPAAIWRGWTLRHGTETLSGSALADLTITPLEEDDMFTDADRAAQTAIYNWIQGDNGAGGTNLDVIKKATTATEASIEALQVPDTRNRLGNIQYALGVLLARDGNSQAFLTKLSADDLAAIAKAVQDEEDARNRARLGQ